MDKLNIEFFTLMKTVHSTDSFKTGQIGNYFLSIFRFYLTLIQTFVHFGSMENRFNLDASQVAIWTKLVCKIKLVYQLRTFFGPNLTIFYRKSY